MLACLNIVRQFNVLPATCCLLSLLVVYRGSDSLSMCFNTVGVLFILDIDNLLFDMWLPRGTRDALELLCPLRTTPFTEEDTRALVRTTQTYAATVPLLTFISVLITPLMTDATTHHRNISMIGLGIAALVGEVLGSPKEKQMALLGYTVIS